MYVIRVRRGEDPWKYLLGVEGQVLCITSIPSKAMVFHSRSDAYIMCGFISNYFISLDPALVVYPLDQSQVIDFSCDINEQYFEL